MADLSFAVFWHRAGWSGLEAAAGYSAQHRWRLTAKGGGGGGDKWPLRRVSGRMKEKCGGRERRGRWIENARKEERRVINVENEGSKNRSQNQKQDMFENDIITWVKKK